MRKLLFVALLAIGMSAQAQDKYQPELSQPLLTLGDLQGRIDSQYTHARGVYQNGYFKFIKKYSREIAQIQFDGKNDIYEIAKLFVVNEAIAAGRFKPFTKENTNLNK